MTNPHSINVWQDKPAWCQPWTIILTGITLIGASWLLFHRWWISIPIASLIFIWWGYFLVLYPRLINQLANQTVVSPPKTDLD
jgi:hypothetical protein